jgi:hypothetical protein
MQHETHISEQSNPLAKIIALVVVVVGLCAIGAYVVYGSGMWSPKPAAASY